MSLPDEGQAKDHHILRRRQAFEEVEEQREVLHLQRSRKKQLSRNFCLKKNVNYFELEN